MCKSNRLLCVVFSILIFSFCLFYASSSIVLSAVPHLINYQTKLTDTSGKPLDGLYTLSFRLYDAEAAGNLLWQGTYTSVLISKGVFSILLGDINDPGFNFAALTFDQQYFLEIKVGDEVMAPRQRIASVGYAIRAEKAESAEISAVSEKIKANSIDSSPGYLSDKVDNSTIEVASGKLKTKDLPAQFATNGYSNLPGGLIIQWGTGTMDSTKSFPVAFPHSCLSIVVTGTGNYQYDSNCKVIEKSATQFTMLGGPGPTVMWIAVGY